MNLVHWFDEIADQQRSWWIFIGIAKVKRNILIRRTWTWFYEGQKGFSMQ